MVDAMVLPPAFSNTVGKLRRAGHGTDVDENPEVR